MSETSASDPNSSDPGVVSSSPLPFPAESPSAWQPNVVFTEPAVDLKRVSWTWAEAVAGTAELLVYGTLSGGPPCAVLGKVEVTESPSDVTITLWAGRRAGAPSNGPQPQLAYPFVTPVHLAEPMGQRTLHDGVAHE